MFRGLAFLKYWLPVLGWMFLIFTAFSVSVTHRRAQIGILRALGVTRGQIQGLFLGEGLLLGLAGSVLGVAGGVLLGRAMMLFMASVVRQTYGLQVSVDRLTNRAVGEVSTAATAPPCATSCSWPATPVCGFRRLPIFSRLDQPFFCT